jgi:hypothetical protein
MKGKLAKTDVAYGEGYPKSHCGPVRKWKDGSCKHFEAPHSCEIVVGRIEPDGWCSKWDKLRVLYGSRTGTGQTGTG